MSKPVKLPKPFLRTLSRSDFENKIARRIHVTSEAEFARSLYIDDPNQTERLLLAAEPDKAAIKHIKVLAKAIKRNRGFVAWGKLAVLGALIVLFVVFNLVFKNLLMTNLLESSLQGIFAARVEVGGLDFDPLGGKITLLSLVVANRDQPMRNLFELGRTGIALDMWQALNGRILVNFVECQEIRFGTERRFSGALANNPATTQFATEEAVPAKSDAALDGFVNLNNLNAAALVAAQLDKLESVQLATSIRAEFTGLTDQAKIQTDGIQAKAKDLVAASSTRIVQNLSSVRSKADLDAALAKSADFKAEIATVQKSANATAGQLQDQLKLYQTKLQDLAAAAQRDQANLAKTIAQPQAAGGALAQSAARQIMGPRSRELLGLAQRIPDILSALGQGKEKPPLPAPRQGRVVNFPVPQHPLFQIVRVEGSVQLDHGIALRLLAENISSDQTTSAVPTTFELHFGDLSIMFDLTGTVDVRPGAATILAMDGRVKGVAVKLGRELTILGLNSLTAQAAIQGNYRLDAHGNAKVLAKVSAQDIQVLSESGSLLGRVSQAAIASLGGQVNGNMELGLSADDKFNFALNSELDAALATAVQSAVNAELHKMQAQLGAELEAQLSKALGSDDRAKQLKQLIADNAADIKTLSDLQKKLDQQSAELQKLGKVFGLSPTDVGKSLNNLRLPGF